ncbi:MAG: hypothetical protein ACYDA0_05660 [Candidatus Dormibacteraceae bacterium]
MTDLLPTTVVGGYPQPVWLVDRAMLSSRLPPLTRALEIWRVPPGVLEQAPDDATVDAIRAWSARASTSSLTERCDDLIPQPPEYD